MNALTITIALLLLNVIVAVIYLVYGMLKYESYNKKRHIIEAYIMFICPIVGPLYFFLGYVFYKLKRKKPVDLDDVSFSKERVKTIIAPDEQKELNTVPLEEAMVISDKHALRRLLLNVLKDSRDEALPAIAKTLASEDSEASHYAASVIMDVVSDFRKNAAAFSKRYNDDPEGDETAGVELCAYVLYFLSCNILAEMEAKTYLEMAKQAATGLMEHYEKKLASAKKAKNDAGTDCDTTDNGTTNSDTTDGDSADGDSADSDAESCPLEETALLALCEALLHMKDFDGAQRCAGWLDRYYPETLERYMAKLKCCYYGGERAEFFTWLEKLKESEIPVGYDVLQMIRMFS